MPVVNLQGTQQPGQSQFPLVLSTGAIARYPLARMPQWSTRQVTFADFSRQAFTQRSKPLHGWDVSLNLLTDAEASDILDFFNSQLGIFGDFTFVDPWNNLLLYSEDLESGAWGGSGSVFLGNNYVLGSQDISNSLYWQAIHSGAGAATASSGAQAAPDGTASSVQIVIPSTSAGQYSWWGQTIGVVPTANMPMTFSVFLYAASPGTVYIGIQQVGALNLVTQSCSVTAGWNRFTVTNPWTSVSPATDVQILIGLPASQTGITVQAWGAQAEYGPVASDYTAATGAIAPLEIADPFFIAAPSSVPGYQWNLNSAIPKRGRQIVSLSSGAFAQNLNLAVGGSGNSRKNGLTLTASLWTKQQGTSNPSASLIVADGSSYESGNLAITPPSSWTRGNKIKQFSASNPSPTTQVQLSLAAMGAIYVFGFQLEAAGSMSDYKKTGAYAGIHSKCNFANDALAHITSEFGLNTIEDTSTPSRLARSLSSAGKLPDVLTIIEHA